MFLLQSHSDDPSCSLTSSAGLCPRFTIPMDSKIIHNVEPVESWGSSSARRSRRAGPTMHRTLR